MILRSLGCAAILLLPAPRPLSAQDSTRAPVLPDVVVTAERSRIPLASSTAAITVLRREDIRALPAKNLADALRQTPGLSFVDFGGSGGDPQLMVRGFYGGGEVDYVLVLLDGEPINVPGSGRVNWDLVPLEAVESIEVLRGPASSLYGDAAIGAVISVHTSREPGPASWEIAGGQHGLARLSSRAVFGSQARSLSAFAGLSRQDGFRDHSRRELASLNASATALNGNGGSATLALTGHRREFQDPGPLPESALEAPEESSPFFRFDETEEDFARLAARADGAISRDTRLSAQLAVDVLSKDAVRTVPLAAEFADTKRRLLDESRLSSFTLLTTDRLLLGRRARWIAGIELGRGTISSTYFDHTTGDAATYSAATGELGTPGAQGNGSRITAAVLAQYELDVSSRLRFVLGARGDRVQDDFREDAASAGALRARHTAFSPRAALNFRYAASARQRGNAYLSAGRSFKAPTLDQLFDRRTVPVPFPPFAITFSNHELRPQYATSLEAGLRHWLFPSSATSVELSAVGYSVKMVDELDFDVQQLRYMNIGRSRHDGVELGIQGSHAGRGSAFLTYSLQDATSRAGDNSGNQLKAIPRTVMRAGLSSAFAGTGASLVVNAIGRAFLDDANTRRIPGYTTLDAKVARAVLGVNVWIAAFNVLDRKYSTTGFADPAGSDVSFFYPAAGRVIQVGISSAR